MLADIEGPHLDFWGGPTPFHKALTMAHLFRKVHLLLRDLRFEHGALNLLLAQSAI